MLDAPGQAPDVNKIKPVLWKAPVLIDVVDDEAKVRRDPVRYQYGSSRDTARSRTSQAELATSRCQSLRPTEIRPRLRKSDMFTRTKNGT